MQSPVDPVYAEVRKTNEKRELEEVVAGEGGIGGRIVELAVTANFGEETRGGKDGHQRHGDHSLTYLELDLVLKVFWVGEGGVIEDEEVG